jgi:hypothetical protein
LRGNTKLADEQTFFARDFLKSNNYWCGLIRASAIVAIATLAIVAPLRAGGPSSAKADKPEKQALWMSDGLGFTELAGSTIRISFGSANSEPGSVTFDGNGNFWGTFCQGGGPDTNGLVFELTKKQLLKLKNGGGIKAAKVAFDNPYPLFDCPMALQFDKSGNLWVANSGRSYDTPSIMEYSAAQLTTGGDVYPAAVFTSPVFRYIWDIKFDSSGNLWIAGDGMPGGDPEGIFELTSEQLAEPATPYFPLVVMPSLELTSTTFDFPGAIAFDASGNLWVGGLTSPVLALAAADLSGSGTISPAPSVTINPVTIKKINSSFYDSNGLAFDREGDLWVASGSSDGDAKNDFGTIAGFTPSQIASSGSPRPTLFLLADRIIKYPGYLTFGPLL